MENLYLKRLKLGPMSNFVYLVGCPKTKKAVVIDPAWDISAILKTAALDGYELEGALVTHFHPDHVGGHLWGYDIEGVTELGNKIGKPIYAHRDEIAGLSTITGLSPSSFTKVVSGQTIPVGDINIEAIHTPGHTPGSQCFSINDRLVSGDTLFISGCGRVDLPGGDSEKLYHSLHSILKKYSDNTVLLPGHDYDDRPEASLGYVRKINPYLKVQNFSEWDEIR